MASSPTSFTVFLCLLFLCTVSWARTPVDRPAIDEANHDSFSESDKNSAVANTIFLPSDRSESEPVKEIQSEPEIPDSKTSKPDAEVETLESTESSEASDRAPITEISFRPVNRHLPWRLLPFSSHRCRHNHKFKPWNPRLPRHQIPYGNDMILSNGEDRSFDEVPGDGVRQIPVRWTRFRRVDPMFSDESGVERSEVMRRPHHHHHDHDHDHHHDHEHHHDHDHDHEHDHHHDQEHDHDHDHEHFDERNDEDGGLMRGIREFLQHF